MTSRGEKELAVHAVPTFDALFVDEYPKMIALAAAVSGSRAHGEDIAQEAMSKLSRNWDRVQSFDKPGAWVRRVTINLALSQKRKLISEAKAVLRLGKPAPTLASARVEDEPVWAAVADLPKQQRAAVSLYFLEDKSIEDIADILDISPSTARVHLHRARQTLRDRLEQEGIR
jgi:RNA polymerase sigma factor (sigma-70 family)